ncbi:Daunorubicin/doxorubicin resistance ATP-binding protein DrrA [compost metagenome]
MEEVENICDRIAIIDKGKIIAEGTKEELISLISDIQSLEVQVGDISLINEKELKAIKGVKNITVKEDIVTINSQREVTNLNLIIEFLTSKNINIKNIGYKEIDLETVFLNLTGRTLRD